MKAFLKDNPTLVFGLGLPVLLVFIFSLAASLPNLGATPPKYDVIFATNYNESYGNGAGYHISVVEGKLNLSYVGECGYYNTPELYRYQPASGSIKRIDFNIPPESRKSCKSGQDTDHANTKVVSVDIPELATTTLNNSNPAPDGYQFTFSDEYSGGGILPSLFFGRSYYNEPELRKGSYRIKLPLVKNYYNYSNARFIGWVESH